MSIVLKEAERLGVEFFVVFSSMSQCCFPKSWIFNSLQTSSDKWPVSSVDLEKGALQEVSGEESQRCLVIISEHFDISYPVIKYTHAGILYVYLIYFESQ